MMICLTTTFSTGVNKIVLLVPSDSVVLKIEDIPGLGIICH